MSWLYFQGAIQVAMVVAMFLGGWALFRIGKAYVKDMNRERNVYWDEAE